MTGSAQANALPLPFAATALDIPWMNPLIRSRTGMSLLSHHIQIIWRTRIMFHDPSMTHLVWDRCSGNAVQF